MKLIYDSSVDISDGGDVEITVLGDNQKFIFVSGLADLIVPRLFSNLISFGLREIHSFELEGYEFIIHYKFYRQRSNIEVSSKRKTGNIEYFSFNTSKFLEAIQRGVKKYLRNQRMRGELDIDDETLKICKKFSNIQFP